MIKFILPAILILSVYIWLQWAKAINKVVSPEIFKQSVEEVKQKIQQPIKPKIELQTPPESKTLPGGTHVFQTFNNCGPAAMSMALSYFGIQETQATLGQALRPYQVPGGNNDDKSVTLDELAEKSKEYGFTPYHRPNGNIKLIKLFITYDIPILTRTWIKENEDIGHYRVIKGFNQTTNSIIQDDSLQGKNLNYSIDQFNAIWKKFNFEYLVLVPENKKEIAETILGEDVNLNTSWTKAVKLSEEELQRSPDDIYARFNLSVALFNTGEYQRSIDEFEKVESKLPFRTLWYQIEPIDAYYKLGNYDRVFNITNQVLNNHNRAFSELYLLRGNIYKKQGKIDLAKLEFEKAVLFNKNLKAAHEAMESVM